MYKIFLSLIMIFSVNMVQAQDPDVYVNNIEASIDEVWEEIEECQKGDITLDDVIGVENPIGQMRECIRQQLEETSEDICQHHRNLDTLYGEYRETRGYADARARVVRSYENAIIIERRYRDDLKIKSLEFNNQADISKEKKKNATPSDRILHGYLEGEYEALADIFDLESSINCRDRINRR